MANKSVVKGKKMKPKDGAKKGKAVEKLELDPFQRGTLLTDIEGLGINRKKVTLGMIIEQSAQKRAFYRPELRVHFRRKLLTFQRQNIDKYQRTLTIHNVEPGPATKLEAAGGKDDSDDEDDDEDDDDDDDDYDEKEEKKNGTDNDSNESEDEEMSEVSKSHQETTKNGKTGKKDLNNKQSETSNEDTSEDETYEEDDMTKKEPKHKTFIKSAMVKEPKTTFLLPDSRKTPPPIKSVESSENNPVQKNRGKMHAGANTGNFLCKTPSPMAHNSIMMSKETSPPILTPPRGRLFSRTPPRSSSHTDSLTDSISRTGIEGMVEDELIEGHSFHEGSRENPYVIYANPAFPERHGHGFKIIYVPTMKRHGWSRPAYQVSKTYNVIDIDKIRAEIPSPHEFPEFIGRCMLVAEPSLDIFLSISEVLHRSDKAKCPDTLSINQGLETTLKDPKNHARTQQWSLIVFPKPINNTHFSQSSGAEVPTNHSLVFLHKKFPGNDTGHLILTEVAWWELAFDQGGFCIDPNAKKSSATSREDELKEQMRKLGL